MTMLREHGFTLIELMIALSIFAFLILIAGPMYADFMGNTQIRNGAENTLMGVRLAQTEALRGSRSTPPPRPATRRLMPTRPRNSFSIRRLRVAGKSCV